MKHAHLAALSLVTASSFVAASAGASPNYPTELQSYVNLSYTPQCSLCHTNDITGPNTVNTPFGVSMREVGGLVSRSVPSLHAAVDALQAAGTDSDGDGVPDITELVLDMDPNGGGGALYGCAARIAPAAPGAGAALAALALAASLFLRRRRG